MSKRSEYLNSEILENGSGDVVEEVVVVVVWRWRWTMVVTGMEDEDVDIGEKKEERETQNKGINIVIIKMIKIALLEFCIYITLGCICEIKIGKE